MGKNRLKDKSLICQDCGREFVFPVKEQKFYGQKGWKDPIRCKVCRREKKILELALKEDVPINDQVKFLEVCDRCGRKFYSKFKRKKGKPFYCDDCYTEIMQNGKKDTGVDRSKKEAH